MKVDFLYSTDFLAMNAPELSHTCMHLLCTAGEGSFVFNEKCYHIGKNDLVVIPLPSRAKNLAAAPGMQVEWFAADYKFLQNLLPSNNYGIGGAISLNHNPVIKLTDEQAAILLADFHRLRDRMNDRDLLFYPARRHRSPQRPHGLYRQAADGFALHGHQSHGARGELLR